MGSKIDASIKRLIFPTLIILVYVLIAYLLFTYATTSIITVIVCFPLSLGFIVGYALGDFAGYLFLGLEVVVLWYLGYLFLRKRIKG